MSGLLKQIDEAIVQDLKNQLYWTEVKLDLAVKSLKNIGKVRYGLDFECSEKERGDYWSNLALGYRKEANDTLKTLMGPPKSTDILCMTCQEVTCDDDCPDKDKRL